jgi:2-keto-4-pentenoate hydratase/2-oxohepta-3-ene-1,7-dioic acid hydratase in catechol pathway
VQRALTPTWQTLFSLDRPGKIVCVGLNYYDHAGESGMPVPAEPLLFGKFPNTLVGPGEPISCRRHRSMWMARRSSPP